MASTWYWRTIEGLDERHGDWLIDNEGGLKWTVVAAGGVLVVGWAAILLSPAWLAERAWKRLAGRP